MADWTPPLVVQLETVDQLVAAPDGIVFSTQPRRAHGDDGYDYFVKLGPDVVFAEIAGCLLAQAVGLTVPPTALCRFGDEVYCGSREVARIGRNADPWLLPGKCRNFGELYSAIVVDAWLVNTDRNLGSILVRRVAEANSPVELVMIDFEKSHALREYPTITSGGVAPRALWPSDDLGVIASRHKGLVPPNAMVQSIQSFVANETRVADVVSGVAELCGGINWSDASAEVVVKRGRRIEEIAASVWNES
jgi:hypothetical protein